MVFLYYLVFLYLGVLYVIIWCFICNQRHIGVGYDRRSAVG